MNKAIVDYLLGEIDELRERIAVLELKIMGDNNKNERDDNGGEITGATEATGEPGSSDVPIG